MWIYNHTNELFHWGIKGMKWGVRRYQNKDGSLTPDGKKRYGEDHDDYRRARSKKPRAMSDKELREAINRLQMEKQYAQLTATEKSYGRKFVESVLNESGKEIAKRYVSDYGKKGIDKLGGKIATLIKAKIQSELGKGRTD